MKNSAQIYTKPSLSVRLKREFKANWQLYLLLLLPVAYFVIFKYGPMYGAQIAFRDYRPTKGILGSDWVGLKHFKTFFNSPQAFMLIKNTLALSIYSLIAGFAIPIILAVSFNYVANQKLKKLVQTFTFIPNFISTVVIVGILYQLFNSRIGVITLFLNELLNTRIDVLGNPEAFRHLYVWSGVWQSAGWNSVIYIAALTGVDAQLHEAAIVDGASKLKRIWHIDLPAIVPTAIIMLILNMGSILSVGYEKVLLMQNSINMQYSQVIDTYVYKIGIATQGASFSYPAAIGLIQSVITFVLVIIANKISDKVSETSLW